MCCGSLGPASACAALALAGAGSSTTFGVADDAGKYAEDGGASLFTMLTQLGMTENRMAVFWDPDPAGDDLDQAFFDRAIPQAQRPAAIEVIFAIYPAEGTCARRDPERRATLRAIRGEGGGALSVRPQGHLPERGEPAEVPPATVRRCRQRHLRLRAGAGDGRVL